MGGRGGGRGREGDAGAARCGSSTASGRRRFNITLGLVTYSRWQSTTALQFQTKKVCNPIPVGVHGCELAHILLQSQITLGWNYQRSLSTSNLSPSRRDQPLLVSGTKRAAASPIWQVSRPIQDCLASSAADASRVSSLLSRTLGTRVEKARLKCSTCLTYFSERVRCRVTC